MLQEERAVVDEGLPPGPDLTLQPGARFVLQVGGWPGKRRAVHVLPEEVGRRRQEQSLLRRPGFDGGETGGGEKIAELDRIVEREHCLHERGSIGPEMACQRRFEDGEDRWRRAGTLMSRRPPGTSTRRI